MPQLESARLTDIEQDVETQKNDIASILARTPYHRGATNANQNFSLTTTSTTADQSIGTYTVTNGKRYVLLAIIVEVYYSTPSTTAALLGTLTIRWGTTAIAGAFMAVNPSSASPFGFIIPFSGGMEFVGDGSTTLNAICTPAGTTSTVWKVSLIGYERN